MNELAEDQSAGVMEIAEPTEDDLMTPEEMQLLKKLQAKRKSQQKALSGVKDKLFEDLTLGFAETISTIKRDAVTISTKEDYSDGNTYAITFGSNEEVEGDGIDGKQLSIDILDMHLSTIDAIMGISNSIKIAGVFEGKKVFWQIRKKV